jgi:hypothetical protein
MWCSHCKKEYEGDFESCLICGSKLEEYVPILSQEEREVLDLEEKEEANIGEFLAEDVLPQLLVTVVGKEEAKRLVALLQNFKIPCMCHLCEEDGEWEIDGEEPIYDLLVPQMMIRKAMRILTEDEEKNGETQEEEIVTETLTPPMEEDEPAKKKNSGGFFSFFGKKQ